jgi:hypothetical protein
MSVKMRQEVERKIATAVIDAALAAGLKLNVDNGGDTEELVEPSDKKHEILEAMFAADEDRLYFYRSGDKVPFGWVYFVYGNDGWDVVNDYTTNLEQYMTEANKISDYYSG